MVPPIPISIHSTLPLEFVVSHCFARQNLPLATFALRRVPLERMFALLIPRYTRDRLRRHLRCASIPDSLPPRVRFARR